MVGVRQQKQLEDKATLVRVLDHYWRMYGHSPTVRELTARAGLSSTSMTAVRLRALRESGFVNYTDNVSRTARLTQEGRKVYGLN
jgi:SOS-response transcriptional repressor LexA